MRGIQHTELDSYSIELLCSESTPHVLMQVWQHSCDVFPFFGNRAITWCSSYLVNMVEAGWNQTLVIRYQCLSDDSKKKKNSRVYSKQMGQVP